MSILRSFPSRLEKAQPWAIGSFTIERSLVSATGSCQMGYRVAAVVGERLGRTILELGGNNAMIVAPSADLDLAVRAVLFSAVGTCGQRCTTLRRLIVHQEVYDRLVPALKKAYGAVRIGDPLDAATLVGPLVDSAALDRMQAALDAARSAGGTVTGGEPVTSGVPDGGAYVSPAIVEMPDQTEIVREETFAPILYVMRYDEIGEAIAKWRSGLG